MMKTIWQLQRQQSFNTMTVHELKDKFNYCMHGLGAFAGVRQTNTKEAFLRWYKKGVKVFEFDIGKTTDNKYVAVAHTVDEKSMRRMEVFEKPNVYDFDWFMKQTLFSLSTKGLTPISLQNIIDMLSEYKDTVFMLDLFGMFTEEQILNFLDVLSLCIGEKTELKERFLIEAYTTETVAIVSKSGYKGIYCARYEYNMGENDVDAVISFLKENSVLFISYPFMYTEKFPGEIEKYSEGGMTVFSRTKYNNKNKKLMDCGVSVNIVSYVFDKKVCVFQYLRYMLACTRRLLAKIYVRIKY